MLAEISFPASVLHAAPKRCFCFHFPLCSQSLTAWLLQLINLSNHFFAFLVWTPYAAVHNMHIWYLDLSIKPNILCPVWSVCCQFTNSVLILAKKNNTFSSSLWVKQRTVFTFRRSWAQTSDQRAAISHLGGLAVTTKNMFFRYSETNPRTCSLALTSSRLPPNSKITHSDWWGFWSGWHWRCGHWEFTAPPSSNLTWTKLKSGSVTLA